MHKRLLLCAFVIFAAIPQSAAGAEGQTGAAELSERMSALEKKQDAMFQQLSSGKGNVGTFLGDEISLGGFFNGAISGIWGPATKTQFSTTPNDFAINLAAELDEGFRLNSQFLFVLDFPLLNPENDPRQPESRHFGDFELTTIISQAYLERVFSPGFSVEVGRGYVPFGIALQLRDRALFRRRSGPLMVTANSEGRVAVANSSWTGVHVYGSTRSGRGQWGYDAYTLTPESNPRTIGIGARAWHELESGMTLGLSTQTAKQGGSTYEALGVDASIRKDWAGMDAEAAWTVRTDALGNTDTFYVEPYLLFFEQRFLVYAALDCLDDAFGSVESGAGGTFVDPFRKWAVGGGINWLPSRYTRFRLGFLSYLYADNAASAGVTGRDYYKLDLSVGVEF